MKILLASALLVTSLSAQTKTPKVDDSQGCSPTLMTETGFSECQNLRISAYLLQEVPLQTSLNQAKQAYQNISGQLEGLEKERMKFIDSIVKNHPGMSYEQPTQAAPIGRLVPTPPPPPPTPKPTQAAPAPTPATVPSTPKK